MLPALLLILPLAPYQGDELITDPWSTKLMVESALLPDTDVDDAAVKVDTQRVGLRLVASRAISDAVVVSWRARVSQARYAFSGVDATGALGTPLANGTQAVLDATYRRRVGERVSWFATGGVGFGVESGASLDGSSLYEGAGGVSYHASDEFDLSLALVTKSRFEDDALVFPALYFDWRPNDDWHVGLEAGGFGVSRRWDDGSKTYFVGSFDQYQYRLNEGEAGAPQALRDFSYDLRVGHEWSPTPRVRADVHMGAVLRELTLLRDDERLVQADLHLAAFLGLRLAYSF